MEEGECVPVAPPPDDDRRPKSRPDFDRGEDPDRLLLAPDDGSDLVSLEFRNGKSSNVSIVESTTIVRCFFEPAGYGIPSNLLDSGNRGFVHTLDAESSDFIEGSSAMLEAVIDGAPIPAESPATAFAAEPLTFSPASRVETGSNDHFRSSFGLRGTLRVRTTETFHGAWTRSSVDLVTSTTGLKPYHVNGLQLVQQQLIAEAPS